MPEQIAGGAKSAGAGSRWDCSRGEALALLVPLLGFVFLATYRIDRPGLYYDELFVVAPAFGAPAYKTWFGLPILVSSYVGADKSLIYWPIFALFGVSPWSVRLPAVLLSCGTLVLGYSLLRNVLTSRWALLFTAACAVHPAFIFLTKVDWGPEVIMLLLKALCLLLCFRWLDGRARSCWTVLLLGVLGFWDKFNFIWFMIALAVATCAVHGDILLSKLRQVRPVRLIAFGIVLLVGGLVTLWIIFPLLKKPAGSGFSGRLMHIWALYECTSSGVETAAMWFKSVPSLPAWTGWVTPALTFVFLLLAFAVRATGGKVKIDGRVLRFCFWCLAMFGVIFLEIALTPQAGGAHHTIMLFPFDLLACFSAAYLLANTLTGGMRRLILPLQGGVLAVWMISNLTSAAVHFREFRRTDGFTGRFSPRIEGLASYLNKKGRRMDAIYCVEWGLGNQLRALCQPAVAAKVRDYWPSFQSWSQDKPGAEATMAELFRPQEKALYVSFSKKEPVFLAAQEHFAEMSAWSTKVTTPVSNLPAELAATYQVFLSHPR